MVSPILNEQAIVLALHPDAPATIDNLRHATMHAILAAYDRKVERNPFYEIEQTAALLLNALTVIEFAAGLKRAYDRSETHSPALEEGLEATANTIAHTRFGLMQLMQKVMECPLDTDKIN